MHEVFTHPADRPERIDFEGSSVRVVPLSQAEHGDDLWNGSSGLVNEPLWRYLSEGPFANRELFDTSLKVKSAAADPLFYAIVDLKINRAVGYAALMRIDSANRVIEVGNILYTKALQRTRAATEAMYLLAIYVFEVLKYRRYEWKCNTLNEPSRKAALRLGFTFEGIFRQHMIVKGENRDTAWYSMLDSEWPARKAEFERWLHPSNFDENGAQRSRLEADRN